MRSPTNAVEATARTPFWIQLTAAVAGALAALAVTWISDGIGALLERVFPVNLRSWEFAAFQVSLVNTPAGALVGLVGAAGKRWRRGLALGTVLHAGLFLVLVATSDSFLAAPLSVNGWVLATGIGGGGLAGATGGLCVQRQTSVAVRVLGAVLLFGVALFCGFGFLAARESGLPNVLHVLRGASGGVAILCAVSLLVPAFLPFVNRGGRRVVRWPRLVLLWVTILLICLLGSGAMAYWFQGGFGQDSFFALCVGAVTAVCTTAWGFTVPVERLPTMLPGSSSGAGNG
jgi:hypothetical protein